MSSESVPKYDPTISTEPIPEKKKSKKYAGLSKKEKKRATALAKNYSDELVKCHGLLTAVASDRSLVASLITKLCLADIHARRQKKNSRLNYVVYALVLAIVAISFWPSSEPEHNRLYSLIALAISLAQAAYLIFLNLRYRKYVRALVHNEFLNTLFQLLIQLELPDATLVEWSRKTQYLWFIEKSAQIVEKAELVIVAGDPITDNRIANENARVAGYLRSLKEWILFPTPLTHTDLIHEVTRLVVLVAYGKWHELPRGEAASNRPITQSKRFLIAAIQVSPLLVAAILIAVLKLVGLTVDLTLATAIFVPALAVSTYLPSANGAAESLFGKAIELAGKLQKT